MVAYEDFKTQVAQMVEEYYKRICQNVEVEITQVLKNNGLRKDAILIKKMDENAKVALTIYLKEFFYDWERGCLIEDIVRQIIDINERSQIRHIDMKQFLDFSKVRKQIRCKIINTDWNLKLLAQTPHIEFLDMSVIFTTTLSQIHDGYLTIRNEHLEMWGISKDDLIEVAMENSRNEEYCISDMFSVIHNLITKMECTEEMNNDFNTMLTLNSFMYVMTNKKRFMEQVLFYKKSI